MLPASESQAPEPRQPPRTLRVVESARPVPPVATQPSGHTAPAQPAVQADRRAADQLASAMKVVKAARFNAAARLEAKQTVSLFTQSMVALYFVGLAVWQAIYAGQIDEPTNRLITFIQIVSSVFTLILGLLEAMNDYKMKAHHLQACALAVSELSQELAIARPADPRAVQDFRRRYNDVMKACPVNHARIDYLKAKLGNKQDRGGARALLALRYFLDVYGLYLLFLAVPPVLWMVLA